MGTSNEESRNPHSVSSKKGLHSIEESIGNEAKLANVMRRLEALKTKDPVFVNQVGSTPSAGCIYCQVMNHVFEEYPLFMAHQMLPEYMNTIFSRPTNNPYSHTYNSDWRNHPNFSWPQNTNDYSRPNFSNIFQPPIINTIFPIKLHNLPSKVPLLTRNLPIWRKF